MTTRARTSRLRLAAHLAPAVVGWAYVAWVVSTDDRRLAGRLGLVQTMLAVYVFVGGLYACWLPARPRYRVLLVVLCLLAAFCLGMFRIRIVH